MNLKQIKDSIESTTQNHWNVDSLKEAKELVLSWGSTRKFGEVYAHYKNRIVNISMVAQRNHAEYFLYSSLDQFPTTQIYKIKGHVGESEDAFTAKVDLFFDQIENLFDLCVYNQAKERNIGNKKPKNRQKSTMKAKFKKLSKGMPYEVEEEDGVLKVIISGWISTLPSNPNKWMKEAYEADSASEELNADRENPSWKVATDALDYVCEQCNATYQEYAFSKDAWIFEINF